MEQSSASSCGVMTRVWQSSREETEVEVVRLEKRAAGTSLRSVWLVQGIFLKNGSNSFCTALKSSGAHFDMRLTSVGVSTNNKVLPKG